MCSMTMLTSMYTNVYHLILYARYPTSRSIRHNMGRLSMKANANIITIAIIRYLYFSNIFWAVSYRACPPMCSTVMLTSMYTNVYNISFILVTLNC